MPRPGGESDKFGNQFESLWTVDALIDVFLGTFKSITLEAFGEDSRGVEFHLENLDGCLQFHSVKRQKQGGNWSVADLCREHKSTNRSILGDLFDKRNQYPDAELRIISSTGANELRELSERADTPRSVGEFSTALSPKLLTEFDTRIVPLCNGDHELALAALKALEVIPRGHNDLVRSVDRRIDELFYRTDRSPLRSDDVRRMLAEFALSNLGPRIDTDYVRSFIAKQKIGVRDWKTDTTVVDAVKSVNFRYLSVTETELINSAHIAREVSTKVIENLDDSSSRGALLVAPGGFGKSCVLAQCLSRLTNDGTPFLCLRMDSIELCNTSRQLGEQLDLPASPAVVLAGIADNASCVLVVDQLDAMSLVSGRNPRMWEVFRELCDEVRSYPNMKMILACRDFDLNHDHRLRSLGDTTSGFSKYTLDKLSEVDIQASLDSAGHCEFKPNDKQIEILGVPFHLLLFLQGDPSSNFTSVGELYDRYWERKRQNLRKYLGRDAHWNQVIDALTQMMSEQQVLFAPKVVTDDWEDDAKAMASEHVLVEVQNSQQYRFFHESFFDYAYARRFCASGRGVVEFLESTEQHLFRRAQVRQILAFRRENDSKQYIADLRDVLQSPNVRFHIKRMVASGFNRIYEPTAEEWAVAEPHILDGDLSRYVSPALRDHVGWFDLLDSLGVFENWLASDDARFNNAAIWYLESRGLHDSRSTRIAELIAPYAERDDNDWRQRILRIMSWGKAHKSSEMAATYLDLIARGAYDEYKSEIGGSDFWSQHHDAEKESPKFVIDVLATWFDRAVDQFDDGESWNFLDKCGQNHSHTGSLMVGKAASDDPEYFVEQMLPRVVATVRGTEDLQADEVRNRAWPYLSNHGEPFDIDDAVLLYLRQSLQQLATDNVELFRQHASAMTPHPHQTFGYLLLRSWAKNPEEFANECAAYLIEDQRRFNIGYGSWSGDSEGTGESAISRNAMQAISPHCSDELFEQMEAKIIGYCNEYEKQTPRWRGYAELLVLRSLDKSRISKQTGLRIEELERKFPDLTDAIVEEDKAGLVKYVGSPIPQETAEIMTDEQWISAMQKYDGSTERFKGGPVELSRLLAEFARADRDRFALLVTRMPDGADPIYFSAILDGLYSRYTNLSKEEKEEDQKIIEATATDTFLDVVDRLHALPDRPCGTAIVGCIRTLSDRQLPRSVLEIVSFYATNDPDPNPDSWRRYEGGKEDLHHHGINCVRGQAAEAIGSLLYDDHSRLDALRPALASLSRDPVASVRACAIDAFLPLLNFSRDLAVDLFLEACGSSENICATHPFDRFVHYAVYTHYEQLRDLLRLALNCNNTDAVENAARQTILAELGDIDVGDDASNIRSGSETMRNAAAGVYAKNLSNEVVGDKCAEFLEEFFSDEAESVRQEVSRAFFHMSGERLLQLRDFIGRFIESRCFGDETDRLLRALEKSNVELPHIICQAAERILELLGEEGTHIAYHGSMVAHGISTLVVRQYEQTTDNIIKSHCLELIDRMEKVGYLGIGEELNKIDR